MKEVTSKEQALASLQELVKDKDLGIDVAKVFEEAMTTRGLLGAYAYTVAKIKKMVTAMKGTTKYHGIILGTTGIVDRIEEMKRIARMIWEKDPERAVSENYTDANGVPLDRRAKIGGNPNPNYLAPLPDKQSLFLMYVARAKEVDGNVWSTYILEGYGSVKSLVMPIGIEHPVEFRATVAKRNRFNLPTLRIDAESLGYKEIPVFKEIGKTLPQGAPFDIAEALEGIVTTPLSELENYVTQNRGSLLITQGIAMNPVEESYFDLIDDDVDTPVRVFFREPQFMLPLPQEGDMVLTVGRPSRRKGREGFNINAWGWIML